MSFKIDGHHEVVPSLVQDTRPTLPSLATAIGRHPTTHFPTAAYTTEPPSRNTVEFVRPHTFWGSFREIARGIKHVSPPVMGQYYNGFMAMLAGMIATADLSALIGGPVLNHIGVSLYFLTIGEGLHLAGNSFFHQSKPLKFGPFSLEESTAYHAYEIHNSPGENETPITIHPHDMVFDVHLDTPSLRKAFKGVPRLEVPAKFASHFREELGNHLDSFQGAFDQSKARAIRLYTHLNPKYFRGLEAYEVKETHLDQSSRAHPTPFRRSYAHFLKGAGNSWLAQVTDNVSFRPLRRWHKIYPARTYLILKEDLPRAAHAVRTVHAGFRAV